MVEFSSEQLYWLYFFGMVAIVIIVTSVSEDIRNVMIERTRMKSRRNYKL